MKQLDKKAVWLFFAQSIIGALFAAFFASFAVLGIALDEGNFSHLGVFIGWMLVVFVVLALLAYAWAKLSYHFWRYELTDLGFRKESGVIYKRYVTIPYTRIQNVDIHRGILARLLGLSDLLIQTAGASAMVGRHGVYGAGAEGRLPGISVADAEVLRDELVRRASQSASAGQGL